MQQKKKPNGSYGSVQKKNNADIRKNPDETKNLMQSGSSIRDIKNLIDDEKSRGRFYQKIKPLRYSSLESTKQTFEVVKGDIMEASSLLIRALQDFKKHPESASEIIRRLQSSSGTLRYHTQSIAILRADAENGPAGDAENIYTFSNVVEETIDLATMFKNDLVSMLIISKGGELWAN